MIWHHKPARLSPTEKINPEAFANVASLETMTLWTFRTTSFDLLKDSWKRLSPFMERFMALPSPSAQGYKDPVQRMRTCYDGLAEFWQEAGKILQSDVHTKEYAQSLPECYLDHICAHKTFEYQMEMYADCSMLQFAAMDSDPLEQPQKPAILVSPIEKLKATDPLAGLSMIERLQVSSKPAIAPIVQSQSSTQTPWGNTTAPVMSFVHRKIKTKTRPAKQDNSAEIEPRLDVEPQHAEPAAPTEPTITLSKRASKYIFETMFRTNKVAIGMTKWEHFVAAMIDAGFSATHTGGSCVSFRDERFGKGAITLRKLHPDPTLNYKMLKSHARRLHAQFGWTDETFVLGEN
ncbi:hypothetical protein Slin15195_G074500 [Septoria linicola]|uniref:Uncharacterized protein n=1 Tax=Septoria linicola TaxID=215465 RepID=A0A9Q9B0M2_9PEZI|nr:hypothetical protein Slin14017_G035620 [Septoria linicola]USW54131.1 hypothetical protein Slin15195_G074500 [Septoria linicola]